MALLALGINHKTASVTVRERVAFSPDQTSGALARLRSDVPITEAAILSTCNRMELYAATEYEAFDQQHLLQWLSDYHNVSVDDLDVCAYFHTEAEAVRHMMRVACGLDSMVLGEPQILGQLKDAFALAQDAQALGPELSRLFQQSFNVAKQVRTDTSIGQNPVSVAFAAVQLAQHIFSDLSETRALLLGAGQTIDLVATHLQQAGVKHLTIANRTLKRAEDLAQRFSGKAITLTDMPNHLHEADIIVASTGAPLPVLGKGAVERALKQRKHKPIFMVDIAVPRDIEQEVDELDDVYLYSVDDLTEIIEENLKSRQSAAEDAEELIDSGVNEYIRQLRSLGTVATVRAFRDQAEIIRDQELARVVKLLEKGESPDQLLAKLARSLTNKLIHAPTVGIRKAGADGRDEVIDCVRELYQLPDIDNR